MTNLSRRQILKGTGAAVGGGLVGGIGGAYTMMIDEQYDNDLPFEFNIYQTDGMAELAAEYGNETDHAQQVVARYVEDAFEDLLERAGIDSRVEATVVEEPVTMHDDYETTAAIAEDWYDTVDLLDGTASHGNLLIHEYHFIDALGKGESGWEGILGHVESCGTSSHTSQGSVLGSGDRLFELEQDEVRSEVPLRLYDEEDEEIVPMEPDPGWVAISGVHELGHNSCLHHEHGDIEIEGVGDDREAVTTVMMGLYYNQEDETHDSVPAVRDSDDIYLENRFSDRAVAALDERY